MKLHTHFLADSANFNADQTFTVFKGGITVVQALSFPTIAKFVIITRLEFDANETKKPHSMQSELTLPGGRHVTAPAQLIALRPPEPPGTRAFANVISQMNVLLEQPGDVRIRTQVDGESLPLLYITGVKVEVIG